jgi:hypothetical protein
MRHYIEQASAQLTNYACPTNHCYTFDRWHLVSVSVSSNMVKSAALTISYVSSVPSGSVLLATASLRATRLCSLCIGLAPVDAFYSIDPACPTVSVACAISCSSAIIRKQSTPQATSSDGACAAHKLEFMGYAAHELGFVGYAAHEFGFIGHGPSICNREDSRGQEDVR